MSQAIDIATLERYSQWFDVPLGTLIFSNFFKHDVFDNAHMSVRYYPLLDGVDEYYRVWVRETNASFIKTIQKALSRKPSVPRPHTDYDCTIYFAITSQTPQEHVDALINTADEVGGTIIKTITTARPFNDHLFPITAYCPLLKNIERISDACTYHFMCEVIQCVNFHQCNNQTFGLVCSERDVETIASIMSERDLTQYVTSIHVPLRGYTDTSIHMSLLYSVIFNGDHDIYDRLVDSVSTVLPDGTIAPIHAFDRVGTGIQGRHAVSSSVNNFYISRGIDPIQHTNKYLKQPPIPFVCIHVDTSLKDYHEAFFGTIGAFDIDKCCFIGMFDSHVLVTVDILLRVIKLLKIHGIAGEHIHVIYSMKFVGYLYLQ